MIKQAQLLEIVVAVKLLQLFNSKTCAKKLNKFNLLKQKYDNIHEKITQF